MKSLNAIILSLILAAAGGSWYAWYLLRGRAPKAWNSSAVRANYVSAQLREVDPTHASLLLSYELINTTDRDYRLVDGPGLVLMSRLKTDRSLSSQEDIHVSYPAFLPSGQRARIALEVRHPFIWPEDNDPAMVNKLKTFVNQRLSDTEELVLFDEASRYQIEFPSGWRELQLNSGAND